jgi:hypothetical protein
MHAYTYLLCNIILTSAKKNIIIIINNIMIMKLSWIIISIKKKFQE